MESRRHSRSDFRGRFAWLSTCLFPFLCIWLITAESNAFCLSPTSKRTLVTEREGALYKRGNVAVYVVKEGDRLSELAHRFYGDPEKAWMIEDANEFSALVPGQVLIIPRRPSNPGGFSVKGYQMIPILTYHHFSTKCSNTLCMPIDEFSRQMTYLKKEGYRTVTMKQVLKFINFQEPLPQKAVAITIDDGYRSVYDLGYPILKRHNFKATLFIYTDFIGNSPNAMTWEQLRQLGKAGFEVEAHTISHADLTRKRKGESEAAYLQRVRRELRVPRKLIYQHLRQKPIWLAYPYGRLNDLVITMAQEEGYRGGVTVIRGSTPSFADPFRVGRNQVMNPGKGRPFKQLLESFRGEALQ